MFFYGLFGGHGAQGRKKNPVWFLSSSHHCLSNQLQEPSVKARVEGRRPRLETERGNHGERQQWKWLKRTGCMWPLHLPLCTHTPHVKPSDACTAALTCQSKRCRSVVPRGGWDAALAQKSNHPLAAHVWEGNNKDVKGLDL